MPQIETLPTIAPVVFHHPICMIISGTTGSGKSNFVKLMIENDAIKPRIDQIWYFMPKTEVLHIKTREDQELHIRSGLPTQEWFDENVKNSKDKILVVIDDQWSKAIASDFVNNLVLVERRHANDYNGVSIICISQNYFQKSDNASGIK